MANNSDFTFKISLSVLNDLGRKLYRSFLTVLGEAVSNSWDADADNVWIYINKDKNSFIIKDDGDGMTATDFQDKFLNIGYHKRKDGQTKSPKGRPYIGRKGIGKLALLSCSDRVSVISKVKGGEYVGGFIDNSGLDDAITSDLELEDYILGKADMKGFEPYVKDHQKGTIIYFDNLKEGIRNSLEQIRKIIALYFRFSLIDESFKIYVDGAKVTLDDLGELIEDTEFLWKINDLEDPYTDKKLKYDKKNKAEQTNLLEPMKKLHLDLKVKGFIASVRKPRDLNITSTGERVGVDLLVNGRLRERNIIEHIPTARVTENYLYGQISFDGLDDEKDRFSTSREGIVADDEKYQSLLKPLRDLLLGTVFVDWDEWRRKHHKDGDPDSQAIPKRERKAEELYNVVSKEYELEKDPEHPERKKKVDGWVEDLANDARYNFSSYAECFISENLVRKHIKENKIPFSPEAKTEIKEMKKKEKTNKNRGNVSIDVRKAPSDSSYLSMDGLANLVDKSKDPHHIAGLSRDADAYKPIRDAVMHTALLTDEAKDRLSSVSENIKGRIKTLLSDNSKSKVKHKKSKT